MDFSKVNFDNGNEDYYKLLNCTQDSTIEQIKREYKLLMLQHHPDRIQITDRKDLELVHKMNEAYAVLSDVVTRKSYDQYLDSGIKLGYQIWLSLPEHKRTLHWCNKPTTKRLNYVEPTFVNDHDLISQFRSYKI